MTSRTRRNIIRAQIMAHVRANMRHEVELAREAEAHWGTRRCGESLDEVMQRVAAFCAAPKLAPRAESDGPVAGHTFEITVRSRGTSFISAATPRYSDLGWWGPSCTTRVRAWNMRDALTMAAQVGLPAWDWPEEDAP